MLKIALQKIIAHNLKNKLASYEIKEKDVDAVLREVRIVLLNSDVNLDVIKLFLGEVKKTLLDKKTLDFNEKLDVLIFRIIKKKLINILGSKNENLSLNRDLNKVLLIGINGSGKTTTTAKLSYFLKTKKNLKTHNVSLDKYRPAAYDQLKKLSDSVDIPSLFIGNNDPKKFIHKTIDDGLTDKTNVLLFDSFGLLKDNEKLVEDITLIKKFINPHEVLFVLDAMSGQEILETVKFFHERLKITGLVISKADSNAPMGAAFSTAYLLKIPIKFLGEGEHIQDLKIFYPDRIASLILGEGDILSLAEKVQEVSDEEKSRRSLAKIMSGHFDLDDLISQIREIRRIGSLGSIFKFLPKISEMNLPVDQFEHQLKIWEVLISSMTKKERRNPKIFKKEPSRKIRVIKGSGRKTDEFNKLLKKWEESKKKIEQISQNFKKTKNLFGSFFN